MNRHQCVTEVGEIVSEDGSSTRFTSNKTKSGWVPEPGAEDLTLTGSFGGRSPCSGSRMSGSGWMGSPSQAGRQTRRLKLERRRVRPSACR
jgi:hypothetical protein